MKNDRLFKYHHLGKSLWLANKKINQFSFIGLSFVKGTYPWAQIEFHTT
jgi:hypothetical protein